RFCQIDWDLLPPPVADREVDLRHRLPAPARMALDLERPPVGLAGEVDPPLAEERGSGASAPGGGPPPHPPPLRGRRGPQGLNPALGVDDHLAVSQVPADRLAAQPLRSASACAITPTNPVAVRTGACGSP